MLGVWLRGAPQGGVFGFGPLWGRVFGLGGLLWSGEFRSELRLGGGMFGLEMRFRAGCSA